MKKLLLLVIVFLPVVVFGQVDLVRWSDLNLTPVVYASNITASNITAANGATLSTDNYGTDTFFLTGNWPSGNNINAGRYVQMSISANSGFKIALSQFNFIARSQGGSNNRIQVRYSKSATFNSSDPTLLSPTVTSVNPNYTTYTNHFPANYEVLPGETVYVRIFAYNTNNNFHIQYVSGSNVGPVFRGTVSSTTVLAVNDSFNVSKNTSTSLAVLSNDFGGSGTISSVAIASNPANGVVSVNSDNTIQFTPYNGFVGTNTFTYTITGSTGGTSTATVTVNVTPPALAEWALTANGNTTFQQPYVTASNSSTTGTIPTYTGVGMALSQFSSGSFEHGRYFEIRVKPNAGKSINLTNLLFEQERLSSGSLNGPTNYSIRYLVTTNPSVTDYDFYTNTSSVLIGDESITSNPSKNIPLNINLNDTQTIIIRFYGRGANDYNYAGWRIKANTLKLRGDETGVCQPSGNWTVYGNGSWIGYVYANTNGGNPPSNAFTTTYRGYITQTENFDMNLGNGAISGTNVCGSYTDNFAVRLRMNKTFAAGNYTFTVGGNDGYRLSVDGGATYIINKWDTTTSGDSNATVYLNGSTNLVLEYFENTDQARLKFSYALSCTASTAPTTISGVNNVCPGSSVTLTASGGTHGTNAVYEWSTNAAFTQIISGQTTAVLTHTPTANSTTYYVRRKDVSPCTVATTSAAGPKTVTRSVPGDQNAFGNDSWIGYAYTWTGTPAATNYIGYVTEATTFDRDNGAGSVTGASGTTNLCSTPTDNFFVRYKMRRTFTAGYYIFTASGDDGYRLSVNGTQVLTDWADHGFTTTSSAAIYLDGSTDLILEYYENGGGSRVAFSYTTCTPTSTAPTSITGNLTVCSGTSTTLTAAGGTAGAGSSYQWGTGSVVGTNIIANQNAVSIVVTPTQQTTYWVRRIDGACQVATAGATVTVNMGVIEGNPSLFGDNVWNVYAYNETSMTPSLSNYKGFYTQNTVSVNTTTAFAITTSPSAVVASSTNTAYQGCPVAADNFTFIQKRKGFPAGSYELRMIAWDDATKVFVNGVEIVDYAGWYNGADVNNLIGVYCLGANSTIEIRTIENGGEAQVKMNLVPTNVIYNNAGWTTTPNDRAVEIQNSINIETSMEVCTCMVKAGTTLTVKANQTLTVLEDIVVENGGKIIIEDDGALVQVDDNATYTGAITSFEVERNTEPMYRYDFTYWSSPVEGFKLKQVSPLTLFDKFYSWNSTTQAWTTLPQPANSTTVMEPGIGYIVRAPQNFNVNPTIRAEWESIFIGKPNNGVKSVTVSNGAQNRWNLIGNPYPSAIDVNAFMTLNQDVVEGAIYLWTHNSAIVPIENGSQVYTYSPSDYITVNAAGMVVAGPQDNSLGVNNGDDFKIASGQSFFIKGKETNAIGNQVTFNNSLRVKEGGQNNQFFRPGPTDPNQNWETTGKHRVWLNLTGGTNAFNQTMVGYIENATNGLDSRYDADVFSGGTVSLYSLLETKKLTIQGRALPFSDQDQVPLGYKTTLTGTLKIALDHFDGLFQGQDVYLEDKVFNIVHNLKESDYTFTTVPGTFNERFVLRFAPAAELGIDNPAVDQNSIVVFRNANQISIKSDDQSIEHVTVYDLLGKVIFDKNNINAQTFSTSQLNVSNQVVIVKVITDTQAEVVKKVIMN